MINRTNKKLLDEFLAGKRVQLDAKSIRVWRTHLLTLLIFLDDTPLRESRSKLVGFKNYLQSDQARRDSKDVALSFETIRKKLAVTREFLRWLSTHKHYRFDGEWIARNFRLTRKESNLLRNQRRHHKKNLGLRLDEVVQLASTAVHTLWEERTRAAAVFLFLTGIRANAFVTLPIQAVDFERMQVKQYPSLGVDTKLSKAAATPILNIDAYPILLDVVKAWDAKVRAVLPPDAMWFSNISPVTGELDASLHYGIHRATGLRKDLQAFFAKAGLAYRSPHQFRHGAISLLRDRATTPRELEAIQQFAMHDNLATTLRYGQLTPTEAYATVQRLCRVVGTSVTDTWTIGHQQETLLEKFAQLDESTQNLVSSLIDGLLNGRREA